MKTVDDYLSLVIREHASKPKFMAELAKLIDPFVQMQAFLAGMWEDFDLDSAVGVQLDVCGMFIGLSRDIATPVTSTWFMFDKVGHGWEVGVWKSPYRTEYFETTLNDADYRKLLKARRAANRWDGTNAGAQAIIDLFFDDPDSFVWIEDNPAPYVDSFFAFDTSGRGWDSAYGWRGAFWSDPGATDLSVTFCFAGQIPPLAHIFLLYQQALPLVSGGVRPEFQIASRDNSKLFAFDVSNDRMGGWDSGVWGASVDYVVTNGLT